MFIKKSEYLDFEKEIAELKVEKIRMNTKIKELEEEKQNIKKDLENEHLENCEQHRKLLAIQRLLSNPFGSYKELLQFRNKIKALVKDSQSNN